MQFLSIRFFKTRRFLQFFALLLTVFAFSQISAEAQTREHLTDEEIELIRDNQELDGRMEIFVKAIDRRLIVLNNTAAANAKQIEKDSDKWGALPAGTKTELLLDISRILTEAIDKMEDVAERDENNELLPYSLHILADGARRFVPELKKFQTANADKRETGAILGALDSCEQILEAAAKIPKPDKKPKPKKN